MVILPIHILAGMLALLFGYVALFAKKGATAHRKAGMGFVAAMIVMSLSGALVAMVKPDRGSIIAGLLTFYFVVTGLMTVRPVPNHKRVQVGMTVAGLAFALFAIWAGSWLAQRGRPEAAPMFLFSAMAIVGVIGDVKLLRAGGIEGKARIKRHLWRLCFAMWVAAASFFWGPPNRVPDIIRIPALLPIPVLTPIAVMFYWLWRMRGKKAVNIATASPIVVSERTAEVMS